VSCDLIVHIRGHEQTIGVPLPLPLVQQSHRLDHVQQMCKGPSHFDAVAWYQFRRLPGKRNQNVQRLQHPLQRMVSQDYLVPRSHPILLRIGRR
jgi:hypothetical protein